MNFDPENPFPLLPEGAFSYADEQEHSAAADAWIGLQTAETERRTHARYSVGRDEQHWIGLPVKALLTPYTEIRRMLRDIAPKPGSTVVDMGAAYGRMGFVIARHHRDLSFIGYECVLERVLEGRRCLGETHGIVLEHSDLSAHDFFPAQADCYFIYDFGSRAAIEKSLNDLAAIARKKPITVVGRGRLSRDTIERNQPWLSGVVRPRHFRHYSIYRSAEP